MVVDVVDVSPRGGIAHAGPRTPPFPGQDSEGPSESTAAMAATLRQYARRYPGVAAHAYVARAATRAAWAIQAFPTVAFLTARGAVAVAHVGAFTAAQATAWLRQAERAG